VALQSRRKLRGRRGAAGRRRVHRTLTRHRRRVHQRRTRCRSRETPSRR
jgi:hypothetical protein